MVIPLRFAKNVGTEELRGGVCPKAYLAADGHVVGHFARQRPRRHWTSRRLERETAHVALSRVWHVLVHVPPRHPHKEQQVHKRQPCAHHIIMRPPG